MDTRQRGYRTAPSKTSDYTTKKEMAERRSFPQCPPLKNPKLFKSLAFQKSLFPTRSLPKAVYFNKPVALSRVYDTEKDVSYFEQIYARQGLLGEGSFGVVYKAKSREDGKSYAIKEQKSIHQIQYAYAEVRNYEKIGDHSNCVQFMMAWEEQKICYIVMEYCPMSLAQYAMMQHHIVEAQLWEIMYDMLKALEFLHCKKLIHLDMKPGNIMMSWGFYKLGDFGLLVDLDNNGDKKTSTISDGDSKYLACEVLNGVYTYSCDIFGLGITVLELATNIELPEYGPLWQQIREEHLPSIFYDLVTSQLAVTVERMMSKDHWSRPSASKILKYAGLKKVCRQDQKLPRNNYFEGLDEGTQQRLLGHVITNENNNIIETPRRPLFDIRNNLNRSGGSMDEFEIDVPQHEDSIRELENGSSDGDTNRRGLFRVRLTYND